MEDLLAVTMNHTTYSADHATRFLGNHTYEIDRVTAERWIKNGIGRRPKDSDLKQMEVNAERERERQEEEALAAQQAEENPAPTRSSRGRGSLVTSEETTTSGEV